MVTLSEGAAYLIGARSQCTAMIEGERPPAAGDQGGRKAREPTHWQLGGCRLAGVSTMRPGPLSRTREGPGLPAADQGRPV